MKGCEILKKDLTRKVEKLGKTLRKRDVYLLFAISNCFWVMVVSIVLMFREGAVNDVIVTAWFTLWAVELYALASITKEKERIRQDDNQGANDGNSEESD